MEGLIPNQDISWRESYGKNSVHLFFFLMLNNGHCFQMNDTG